MFKKIKNKFKSRKPDNVFTEPEIIDRRIEKSNICRTCKSPYGDKYENITILRNGENLTLIICKKCGSEYYYRNWYNE